MTLRLFVELPLAASTELALPAEAARHVQVRRLQPADALVLFDGRGGEWHAQVLEMGRRDVTVRVLSWSDVTRDAAAEFVLALGMPANERMDALVEKATEHGVHEIQPLLTERSVLRLDGERAQRRVAHWQAVAVGAAEQSGRTRVPHLAPVRPLADWLATLAASLPGGQQRHLLSTGSAPVLEDALRGGDPTARVARWIALSGPEGGLSASEEAEARACGFAPVSLGPRILRADTAPLAWLARMAALQG